MSRKNAQRIEEKSEKNKEIKTPGKMRNKLLLINFENRQMKIFLVFFQSVSVSLFNGISTFASYSMPKPSL